MDKNIIIVDIDGTLADSYKWQKKYFTEGVCDEQGYLSHIHEFPFRHSIVKLIELYINSGHEIMFLTSRPISVEKETKKWLSKLYDLTQPNFHVNLRKDHDYSESVKYKCLVIEELIDNDYTIDLILDDNPKLIESFLSSGYPVLAVPNSFSLYGGLPSAMA